MGGRLELLVAEPDIDARLTPLSPGPAAAIIDALQQRGPARLALCALLRKPTAIALDLPVAYIGFDIPDEFVVGCGMDYAERHRNLRGIHRLVFDERRED